MADDTRPRINVRLDPEVHRAAKRRMVEDGATFQSICEAAIRAYAYASSETVDRERKARPQA